MHFEEYKFLEAKTEEEDDTNNEDTQDVDYKEEQDVNYNGEDEEVNYGSIGGTY